MKKIFKDLNLKSDKGSDIRTVKINLEFDDILEVPDTLINEINTVNGKIIYELPDTYRYWKDRNILTQYDSRLTKFMNYHFLGVEESIIRIYNIFPMETVSEILKSETVIDLIFHKKYDIPNDINFFINSDGNYAVRLYGNFGSTDKYGNFTDRREIIKILSKVMKNYDLTLILVPGSDLPYP